MEYLPGRCRRRLTRPGIRVGMSSITSIPAISSTEASRTDLTRYQREPRLQKPRLSVTCSNGDSARIRESDRNGTYTRWMILSLVIGNSLHHDCRVSRL